MLIDGYCAARSTGNEDNPALFYSKTTVSFLMMSFRFLITVGRIYQEARIRRWSTTGQHR